MIDLLECHLCSSQLPATDAKSVFDGTVQSNMSNEENDRKGHPSVTRGTIFILITLHTVSKSKIFHANVMPELEVTS